MFPFPIAKPQGCDIQTFYGSIVAGSKQQNFTWNKPVGVSHVYMLLIGGGGQGSSGTTGGGAGAVTVWYGAAQHVPNNLIVWPSSGDNVDTVVQIYTNSRYNLLTASSGSSGTGATQMSSNYFAASGFFYSVAGPNGAGGNVTPSAYSFLSGGATSTNPVSSNYGYRNDNNSSIGGAGYFQMQPIIVGVGGSNNFKAGIGCGTGSEASEGSPGMVLIASW